MERKHTQKRIRRAMFPPVSKNMSNVETWQAIYHDIMTGMSKKDNRNLLLLLASSSQDWVKLSYISNGRKVAAVKPKLLSFIFYLLNLFVAIYVIFNLGLENGNKQDLEMKVCNSLWSKYYSENKDTRFLIHSTNVIPSRKEMR